ncbi:MAG: hypothetical protein VB036_16140 [Propionicimonas sp.]|nr:hypothetical protein [Propionicimonas sp.]
MSTSFEPVVPAITPATTAEELARIAATRPDLGAVVAWHPNAYDELLDWLAVYGSQAARDAVRARRAQPAAVLQPAAPTVTPSPAPRRRRPAVVAGVAAGVVVFAVVAAFAVEPVRSLFAGPRPTASAPVAPAQTDVPAADSFGVDAASSFVNGIGVAWTLDLDDLEPTGEDRGFSGVTDYGAFWLVSSHQSIGDLAHGGHATAVDAATGTVLWSLPDGGVERQCANRLVAGQLICLHTTDEGRQVESIEPDTGAVAVEKSPGFSAGAVAALDDAYLLVGDDASGQSSTVRLALLRPGGELVWTSRIPGWCTTPGRYDLTTLDARQTGGQLVVTVNNCLAATLDPATGEVADSFGAQNLAVLTGGLAAEAPYCQLDSAASDDCRGTARRRPDDVAQPDGSRLPLRRPAHGGYVWSGTDGLLDQAPASWYLVGGDDCFLSAVVDAASGRELWRSSDAVGGFCPVQVGDGQNARPAFLVNGTDGGDLLTLLDLASGEPVWQRPFSGLTRSQDSFGYFAASPDAQTILEADDHGLNAFATADGRLVWQGFRALDDSAVWWQVVPGPGRSSVVEQTAQHLARLVPATAPTRVESMPQEVPDCPAGWSPVSWSTWVGGHTLVCSTPSLATWYLEFVDGQTVYRTDAATQTPTGWSWTSPTGVVVSVAFAGGLVQLAGDGEETTRFPAAAWHDGTSTALTDPPASVPVCPAGAWPLSLSVWKDGWLLVCGTAADAPVRLTFSDGARTLESTSVSYQDGTYCGQAGDARVCAYQAPALVTVESDGGQVVQHSVAENWYAGAGHGGAGEGTGSYDVDTPEGTAADQLRYLDQILDRSRAARKTLTPSIDDVLACRKLGSAITRIDAVTANRDALLEALRSTPVDALPEGERIVTDLRFVLDLSRATDQAYADWARTEQDNGCTGGRTSPEWAAAQAADDAVDGPKDAFVAYWNSSIAPKYGVRDLANSDI